MQFAIVCLLLLAALARGADISSLLENDLTVLTTPSNPTEEPTAAPTTRPTRNPTARPTSAAPTRKPSARPTIAPTALNLVTFTASHTVYDLVQSAYNANQAAYDLTIRQAVADTMSLTQDSVQDVIVEFPITSTRRTLTTASAEAQYTIVAHVNGATYESLSTQLKEASVAGGTLNTYIATRAAANGVADFTVDPPVTENLLYQRGHSTKLTGAQITGLIIGIFLFLALAATIVAFVMSSLKPAASERAHSSVETQV